VSFLFLAVLLSNASSISLSILSPKFWSVRSITIDGWSDIESDSHSDAPGRRLVGDDGQVTSEEGVG
jgi:hypothetical protein